MDEDVRQDVEGKRLAELVRSCKVDVKREDAVTLAGAEPRGQVRQPGVEAEARRGRGRLCQRAPRQRRRRISRIG